MMKGNLPSDIPIPRDLGLATVSLTVAVVAICLRPFRVLSLDPVLIVITQGPGI